MDASTPAVVIAELEATPSRTKDASTSTESTPSGSKDASTSTESKDEVKVMVVGSTEHEGLKFLSGEKSGANTQILEEVRQSKLKNPAVLVNLPSSPSAQAYEVTQQAKPDGGYFEPVYTEAEEGAPAEEEAEAEAKKS